MKSILEILAVGATLAALATVANAGSVGSDAKVNVGTAAPAVAAPVCSTATAPMPANGAAGAAVKPACSPPAAISGKPAPTPVHH